MKPSKRKINVIDLSLLEHLGKEIRDKVMTLNFKEIEGQRISIPHKSNYQIIRRNEKICEQSKELSYTELAQIHDRSIRQIRRITAPGSEYWRGMKSWDPSGLLQDAMSNATIPDKISATSVTPLTPVIPTAKRIERSKYIKAKDAERIYGIKAANFYLWARTKKNSRFRIGKTILFDRNELTDFLKENKGEIPKNFGGYKQLFIDLWGRDIERHMPEVIERLHPTLRYVIEQHYLKNRSIREIAEHKKVSRSRIDQIKHQAYRSLRHPSRTQIKFNTYISPKKRDANIIKGLIEGSLLVDDLPLSVRAANCLKNAGIFDSATAFSGKTKDEGGWRITGTATVILICWIPMMVMCLRR